MVIFITAIVTIIATTISIITSDLRQPASLTSEAFWLAVCFGLVLLPEFKFLLFLFFSESGHQLENDLLQGVVQPEHLQRVGLMDLNATFRTVIALLKVLHDAALTKRVQALGDRGRFNQVTSTQVTGDEMVKVSHQVLPSCSSHVWSIFATVQQDTDKESEMLFKAEGMCHLPALQESHVHSQRRSGTIMFAGQYCLREFNWDFCLS